MYYLVTTNWGEGNKIKLMEDKSKLLFMVYAYYIIQPQGSGPRRRRRLPAFPQTIILYTTVVGLFQVPAFFSTCIDKSVLYLSIKHINNISLNTIRHYDMHIIIM